MGSGCSTGALISVCPPFCFAWTPRENGKLFALALIELLKKHVGLSHWVKIEAYEQDLRQDYYCLIEHHVSCRKGCSKYPTSVILLTTTQSCNIQILFPAFNSLGVLYLPFKDQLASRIALSHYAVLQPRPLVNSIVQSSIHHINNINITISINRRITPASYLLYAVLLNSYAPSSRTIAQNAPRWVDSLWSHHRTWQSNAH